jgi:single-stranded DNA-specific DHH superfamily exonuclease
MLLEKAAEFLKDCKPEETIVIYHKGCGDGICASAILGKYFKKTHQTTPKKFFVLGYEEDFKKFTDKILKLDIKNVIFADLSLDKFPELLKELAKKFRVLILDHHTLINDMNKHGILHIHPNFISKLPGEKYCGSKIAYDVCNKIIDMSDASWLAAAGILHDVGAEDWKPFMNEVYAKFPDLKGGKNIYGFDSKLGELVSLISASKIGIAKEIRTINLCINTENPMDILELKSDMAKELKYWEDKINTELTKYIDNWKELAEIHEDLKFVMLEIEGKYPISSTVSTIISMRNPDYLFCVYKKKSTFVDISFRHQGGKVNCAKLAQESTKGFELSSGGGHPPAAGARVLKNDFDLYKSKLPDLVRKLIKNGR